MTRSGEKLYAEPDLPERGWIWALVAHPESQRGAWAAIRVIGAVYVVWFMLCG